MKRFNIVKKFNKVNDDFIDNFFKEKNISKEKKEEILEKYNNNKNKFYYIEIIDLDNKKIKFKNFLDMLKYLQGLIRALTMFSIWSLTFSVFSTVILINNSKSWDNILFYTSLTVSSLFVVYFLFKNIKELSNLIKEIESDNKVYLEERKNDNLIDV
jgi:hypothetical protein